MDRKLLFGFVFLLVVFAGGFVSSQDFDVDFDQTVVEVDSNPSVDEHFNSGSGDEQVSVVISPFTEDALVIARCQAWDPVLKEYAIAWEWNLGDGTTFRRDGLRNISALDRTNLNNDILYLYSSSGEKNITCAAEFTDGSIVKNSTIFNAEVQENVEVFVEKGSESFRIWIDPVNVPLWTINSNVSLNNYPYYDSQGKIGFKSIVHRLIVPDKAYLNPEPPGTWGMVWNEEGFAPYSRPELASALIGNGTGSYFDYLNDSIVGYRVIGSTEVPIYEGARHFPRYWWHGYGFIDEIKTGVFNYSINITVNDPIANVTVAQWYPKGSEYVFICDTGKFKPTSYSWWFGDGEKLIDVTEKSVFHRYEEVGTYTVMCSATDGNVTGEGLLTIAVEEVPEINIHEIFPADQVYVFECETDIEETNSTVWTWDFGDGTKEVRKGFRTYSIATNPYGSDVMPNRDVYHEFPESGEFDVTCTASDGERNVTAKKTVDVDFQLATEINLTRVGDFRYNLHCDPNGFKVTEDYLGTVWQIVKGSEVVFYNGPYGAKTLDLINFTFPEPGEYEIQCLAQSFDDRFRADYWEGDAGGYWGCSSSFGCVAEGRIINVEILE